MTTIAIKDNIMCSDAQCTVGEMAVSYDMDKIEDICGFLVGGSGRWASIVKFRQWFEQKVLAEVAQEENPWVDVLIPEDMVEDDFMGVVLTPEGSVLCFEGGSACILVEQPYATGSGMPYALAAMKAGASAEEAVAVAIDMDVFSGGEVRKLELQEGEEPLTREEAADMDKDELIELMFGKEGSEEDTTEVIEEQLELPLEEGIDYEGLKSALDDKYRNYDGILDCGDELIIFFTCLTDLKSRSITVRDDEVAVGLDNGKDLLEESTDKELKSLCKAFGINNPHNSKRETTMKKLKKFVDEVVDIVNKYK